MRVINVIGTTTPAMARGELIDLVAEILRIHNAERVLVAAHQFSPVPKIVVPRPRSPF